jgi:hypothetical protein
MSAAIIARPETPKMSEATTDSFDAGVLEQFLDPVLLRGTDPDQISPIPCQVPQPANVGRRDEAGPQHLPLGDLAQPHRIKPVGLRPAGQVLDVLGVDQPRIQPVGLEQVERRPPVIAGCLHHHPLHTELDQPVRQLAKRRDHRRVRRHLLHPSLAAVCGWETDAAHDLGFADVQCCDPLDDLLVVIGFDEHLCSPRFTVTAISAGHLRQRPPGELPGRPANLILVLPYPGQQ